MVRRWIKIGGGIASGVTTILALFVLLSTNFGFVITDLTGNFQCEGTYEEPCVSRFTVRNPTPDMVDIYSKDQVKLSFSPEILDYALFVPDKRCSATGRCACELEDGRKLGFEDWRCVDFTNKTKPRTDKVYNFRFDRYSTTEFLLAGIKKKPSHTIKWSFGTEGKELDPIWIGTGDNSTIQELCTKVNRTKLNITPLEIIREREVSCKPGAEICLTYANSTPYKMEKYSVWVGETREYTETVCELNGAVSYENELISFEDFFCRYCGDIILCHHNIDGLGKYNNCVIKPGQTVWYKNLSNGVVKIQNSFHTKLTDKELDTIIAKNNFSSGK